MNATLIQNQYSLTGYDSRPSQGQDKQLTTVLINEISFELQMETISMLMIFAVMLCYLSSSERKAKIFQAFLSLLEIVSICSSNENLISLIKTHLGAYHRPT